MSREEMHREGFVSRESLPYVLRYLSAPGEIGKERRRRAARCGLLARLMNTAQWNLNAEFERIVRFPIVDESDGRHRVVNLLWTYRFVLDRSTGACNTRVPVPFGRTVVTGSGQDNEAHWDRILSTGAWRRRVQWVVMRNATASLLVLDSMPDHVAWFHSPAGQLAYRYVTIAAGRLGLRKRILESFDRQQLRRQVKAGLGIEEPVWRLARVASLKNSNGVSDKWMSFVLRHREVLERIQRQTPTLLAPAAEMMFRLPELVGDRDPVQALKEQLLSVGVPEQAYLLLVKHGVRPFRVLLDYGSWDRPLNSLIAGLHLCRDDHQAGLPSPALQTTAAELFAIGSDLHSVSMVLWNVPPRFLREGRAQFWAARSASDLARVKNQFVTMLDWAGTVDGWRFIELSPSWARWYVEVQEQERIKSLELDLCEFPAGWPQLSIPGYLLTPITDNVGLYGEARSMRNCLRNYLADFERGDMAAAHVVELASGTSATVAVELRSGRWELKDVRGRCNRSMHRGWKKLGDQVAAAMTDFHR